MILERMLQIVKRLLKNC